MTALTDAIRSHFVTCVDAGHFDGDGLDVLLAHVEALQDRVGFQPPRLVARPAAELLSVETSSRSFGAIVDEAEVPKLEILTGNADLEQPNHDAHVRTMEAREVARRV